MIEDAKEELKRADHLIFVSLKYTRTMDVIDSIVKRLISAHKIAVDSLVEYLKEKKKIKEIPFSFKEKLEILRKKMKQAEIKEFIEFTRFLIRIDKSDHSKKEEFRKNVALIAMEKDTIIAEVSIAILKEYYKKTESLINFIFNLIKGIKEEY